MTIRSVTWGDDFSLKVRRAGGMPKVVARLADVWGKTAESRGTLDKLRNCHVGPEAMTDVERWRAYQVLVVIGQDPADWGIDRRDLGVPPSLVDYFHRALDGPGGPGLPRLDSNQKPTGHRRTTSVEFPPVTPWLSSSAGQDSVVPRQSPRRAAA